MESQQIVDYIAGQLKAGHSEAALRSHMVEHGWSESAVQDAFRRFKASREKQDTSRPATAPHKEEKRQDTVTTPRRGGREGLRRRSKARAVVVALFVIALAVAGYVIFHHETTKPTIPVVHAPTLQQRQSLDVVTLGGAVGQYVATNNKTLPMHVSPAPDGSNSVVLCGTICDPSTWQVSSLSAYKPTGVKMVSYDPSIEVPDVTTMYLVVGARCNQQGNELSTKDVKALSMSILYASQDSGTLRQHCVIL
jgi:hypothetical protein